MTLRERRLVAIGILLALIALIWLGVVRPVADGFAARAERREALLATYERGERLRGQLGPWAAQARRQAATGALYALSAPDAASATETARALLRTAVAASGAAVGGVRELPAGRGEVRLRADARATPAQLSAALARAGAVSPALSVESLSVNADGAFAGPQVSPMDMRLEISVPWTAAHGPR